MNGQQLALVHVAPTQGRARSTDRETSRAAARTVRPGCEAEIRQLLATLGGLTADELAGLLPHRLPASVKSAIARAGVLDSGVRRPSRTGRASVVWVLAR